MFEFVGDLEKNIDKAGEMAIIVCIIGILGIIVCYIIGNIIDGRKKDNTNKAIPFSDRHPKLNMVTAICLLAVIISVGYIIGYYILYGFAYVFVKLLIWIKNEISKLDAVVIVALITGAVSIAGVIISSIVAKIFDYKKRKQEYLTQKRELPYGEFVEMIYKMQQNAKNPGTYTEQMMLEDLSKFSRQITLWGSPKVVNKWVEFRENGAKPNAGKANLFIMEDIMNEMRKDLGLKKVKKGNLLAFFVNDIKKSMRKK